MDEAFLIRAKQMLGQPRRLRLDHESLVALISERQSASPTARIAADVKTVVANGETDGAAMLIRGGDGWRRARAGQQGCFNRAEAARRLNLP